MSNSCIQSENLAGATKKACVKEATIIWQVHQHQAQKCLHQAVIVTVTINNIAL